MKQKTPRLGHEPIEMSRFNKPADINVIGGFCWHVDKEKRRVIWIAIPCPFEENSKGWVLTRWTIDHKNQCDAQWSWNGDELKPTMKPSLHAVGTWHGHVINGRLTEA